MTSWDDNTTLGVWLGYLPDEIERLRNEGNNTVKGAAFKMLTWFYAQSTEGEEAKWSTVIEALRELRKDNVVQRLGLESWREAARMERLQTTIHELPQLMGKGLFTVSGRESNIGPWLL